MLAIMIDVMTGVVIDRSMSTEIDHSTEADVIQKRSPCGGVVF